MISTTCARLLHEAQARDPLGESTTALVMAVQARAGRPAAALAAYETVRQLLDEELGTIPGPGLQDLHQRILRGDPDLLSRADDAHPATSLAQARRDAAPADRFFGRSQELVEVAGLLEEGRLITLTGPGGSGKTRLSQEVLGRHLASGGLGWFVELAPVRETSLAASAVARLGLGVAAGTDPADMLVDRLADVSGLLVLDNAEHLPGLATFVRRLHRGCRNLRLLVTSRQPLQVEGEQQFAVPVLPVPASTLLLTWPGRRRSSCWSTGSVLTTLPSR